MPCFVPHGTDAAHVLTRRVALRVAKRCRCHRPRVLPSAASEERAALSCRPLRQLARSATSLPEPNKRPKTCASAPFTWDISDFAPCIPQTMECALAEAQDAVLHALSDGLRRIAVELPMGRMRKYWYRLAPHEHWLCETGILASHFVEVLRSADVRAVVFESCGQSSCAQAWIGQRQQLKSIDYGQLVAEAGDSSIVVVVGVPGEHVSYLEEICENVPDTLPVVLLNCMTDSPIGAHESMRTFVPTYMCKAVKRGVFARFGHRAPWHIFVEVAVFEYDWIADVPADESFVPTQHHLERAAEIRGSLPSGNSGYYQQIQSGCQAGFWPFMTLFAKYVLPLDGDTYLDQIDAGRRKRKAPNSSRPFGFF